VRKLAFLALAMLALNSAKARAAYHDGGDLLQDCASSSEVERTYCLGYVVGIADAIDLARERNKKPSCVPAGTTPAQLRDVVSKALASHPAAQSRPAAGLVARAIRQTWTCQ
jgi:hypothetical protein